MFIPSEAPSAPVCPSAPPGSYDTLQSDSDFSIKNEALKLWTILHSPNCVCINLIQSYQLDLQKVSQSYIPLTQLVAFNLNLCKGNEMANWV